MIYYNSNKISDWNLGDDNIIKVYKGVKGAPPTPRLPQGYTEVEYIENTSTAYINLGVKLNQTLGTSYSISTKIYSEYLSSGFGYLIGDEGTSRPYNGMCLRWNAGRLECVFVPTTDGTYVNVPNSDGTSAITISSEGVTQTNNVDLSLFCGIWSSGPWRNGKGRIYTFSLTMNNELVRDLVPAKRDSDNVVGLYDIVNNEFLVSPNNVDFVAGNVVTPTSSGYTGVVCYYKIVTSGGTTSQTPCYAVVDDISQYSDTEFEDVFNNADEKWYKLNNLNEYEEYGIYASGRTQCGGSPIVEYIERDSTHNGYMPLGEYFTEDTVIQIDFQMTQAKGFVIIGDYFQNDNDDWRVFLNFDIQINNLMNYDFLTTRINKNIGNWSNRFHLEIGNYYIKDLDSGSNIVSGTPKTNFTRPNQMYLFHLNGTTSQQNTDYGKVYSLKIWQGDTLAKDFIPWTDGNGNYGLYDNVSSSATQSIGSMTGYTTTPSCVTTYEGKLTLDDGYEYIYSGSSWVNVGEVSGGTAQLPIYYDEKQDPPQSVSFSSMTEAEEYECPYVGLDADIDGTDYIFDENYNWVTKYGLFEVSGYVCDSGDKYQKMEEKVRNVDDTWSSQDPPVYEKGALIESASTDCGGCSRLPQGYTEVEYIENTSTAYIDTGLYLYDDASNTFTFEAKMYSAPNGRSEEYLFSTEQGNASPYVGFICRWYQRELYFGANVGANISLSSTDNQDGTSGFTASTDSTNFTNTTSLTFFCGKQGNSIWRQGRGKLYSSTVIKNGVTIGEFIPCQRDSDNKVGLYNIINNEFLVSPNNVDFVAGDVVPCRIYDAEIEYLESSGSQYINTGVYLNTSNFEVGYNILGNQLKWGYTHQGSGRGTWIWVDPNSAFFGNFNNGRVTIASDSNENIIKYISQSGITVNNNFYSKSFQLGSDSISSIPLYFFSGYDFRNGIDYGSIKLKSFYLKNNGELVLDMIPVRVGQVGYMYDKVSGELFGNAGSGDFILGADK